MDKTLNNLKLFKSKLKEYIDIASDYEDYERVLTNKDIKPLNEELLKLLTKNENIIFSKWKLWNQSLETREWNLGNIYYAILGNIYVYTIKSFWYQVIQDLSYIINQIENDLENVEEYTLTKSDKFNLKKLLELRGEWLWSDDLQIWVEAILSMNNDELANTIHDILNAWESDWWHSKTNIENSLYDNCKNLMNNLIDGKSWKEYKELEVNKNNFWTLFKDELIHVSKKLFDDEHYSNSVFEWTKILNNKIKKIVKDKTWQEYDWTDLMNRAFSPKKPIIVLWDLETETWLNVQQWYMDMYRWTMSAIRNPKWHETILISQDKAIHFLFLINLLLVKLDEAYNLE